MVTCRGRDGRCTGRVKKQTASKRFCYTRYAAYATFDETRSEASRQENPRILVLNKDYFTCRSMKSGFVSVMTVVDGKIAAQALR